MTMQTPATLMATLIDARTNRDVDRAVLCDEPDATVVAEPGTVVSGRADVRAFTEAAARLAIRFGEPQIVEGEGIALHVCAWTLHDAAGGVSVEGRTASCPITNACEGACYLSSCDWGNVNDAATWHRG
jgi:hypothetical protein